MNLFILVAAAVIIICVFLNKISVRIGVPMLLAFIVLGMFFGTDGLLKIKLDNYSLVADICSAALIFIMFYGGFGTNISKAKPVLIQAALLSSLGVFMTAFSVGLFCHFILKMDMISGMLMGSVISSTDAASVFSILRSKKLGLKHNTASLLEVESGSNDPSAYMLTIVFIKLLGGKMSAGFVISTIALQFSVGIVLGLALGFLSVFLINKIHFGTEGFNIIFVVGLALAAYAIPSLMGGNGYLSVYIAGLIIGNSKIAAKKNLVIFFDGMTGLMQMLIFFLLGLLAAPSRFAGIAVEAISIMLFLTVLARPAVVWLILKGFKCSKEQILLVSFAGLRGAASIVFAIMVMTQGNVKTEIFDAVFFIVLMSILIQGALLPKISEKLDMIDRDEDIMKTFTDYSEELPIQFIEISLPKNHAWTGKKVGDLVLPPETLIVYKEDGSNISVPNGSTILKAGDRLVLSATQAEHMKGVELTEISVSKKHEYIGKKIADISNESISLIILIKRGRKVIVPRGNTIIKEGDLLICNRLAPSA